MWFHFLLQTGNKPWLEQSQRGHLAWAHRMPCHHVLGVFLSLCAVCFLGAGSGYESTHDSCTFWKIMSGMVQAWVGHFVTPLKCMYNKWLTSHESETAQKAQTRWQTPSPWWWSCSPLQRRGFDEPMPPEGWAALRMCVPMPPLKQCNKFIKLM